jgi:phage/plasmid-like protein (TIGR03299 family)
MSQETMQFLNARNILVGCGEIPWWYDEKIVTALIASGEIESSPLFDGPVPIEEARQLFSEVITGYVTAALKEVDANEAMLFLGDGTPYPYRVVISEEHKLVGPEGRDVFFECFKRGYDTENHQFADVLLEATAAIIGGDVQLKTAGKLRDGAVAFTTVGVPETFTTPEGVEFRSNLTAASSFNGKIATQWGRHNNLTVCDNTMDANLRSAADAGQLVKVKHTANSFLRIKDAREALCLIESGAEEFAQELSTLCQTPVSSAEWNGILNNLVPLPTDEAGKVLTTGRGYTMAANKRETLQELLQGDDRVAPWAGSAFGVVQAFNTYNQHEAIVRGPVHRAERHYENVITGKVAERDRDVLKAISEVCERELVLA